MNRVGYVLLEIGAIIIFGLIGAKVGDYLSAMAMLVPPEPPAPRVLVLRSTSRVEIWLRYHDADLRVQ